MSYMKTSLRSAGIWISDEYILLESLADQEIWGIPGGSVKSGESVEHACIREYLEETGLTVGCDRLAIIHENFWNNEGLSIQEYCFYFTVTPADETDTRPVVIGIERHIQFHWHPLASLGGIDFVPQELIGYLTALPSGPVFVSSREEK